MMDQASIFSIVFTVGFGFVALLHGVGIYLLHQVKTFKSKGISDQPSIV